MKKVQGILGVLENHNNKVNRDQHMKNHITQVYTRIFDKIYK
jgi:hypothetical protein